LQRDVMEVMTGRPLRDLPPTDEQAAADFRQMLGDAFAKDESFAVMLQRLLDKWKAKAHSGFEFINDLNEERQDAYEPIPRETFYRWLHGEKPATETLAKIASGTAPTGNTDETLNIELMLCKMVHGSTLTAEDVGTLVKKNHRGRLLKGLYEASGISRSTLLAIAQVNTATLSEWMDDTKPGRNSDESKATDVAKALLRYVDWGETPPEPGAVAALEKSVVEQLTDKRMKPTLMVLIHDAHEDSYASPRAGLCRLLCDQTEMERADLAKELKVSIRMVDRMKSGERRISADEATTLLALAKLDKDPDSAEAVRILTDTPLVDMPADAPLEIPQRKSRNGHTPDALVDPSAHAPLTKKRAR